MGVKGSDIPARLSGKTPGGVVKRTSNIAKGARERTPEKVVMDSDNPPQLSGTQGGGDAVDTSKTVNG